MCQLMTIFCCRWNKISLLPKSAKFQCLDGFLLLTVVRATLALYGAITENKTRYYSQSERETL